MSLQGLFQIGYVTHDLDRAIASYAPLAGTEFATMDIDLPAQTPDGDKVVGVRVAVAWIGGMQVELIQPVSGHIDCYLESLPADRSDATPRLHHLAVRRDDLEQMRAEVAAMGVPVLFETGGNGIHSMFVDARAQLGHHLELVCSSAEGWAMLGWPDKR